MNLDLGSSICVLISYKASDIQAGIAVGVELSFLYIINLLSSAANPIRPSQPFAKSYLFING